MKCQGTLKKVRKNIHVCVRPWANISTVIQVQSERDNHKWDEIDMAKELNVVSWIAFHTCDLLAILYQQHNCVSRPGQNHIFFLSHNLQHVAFYFWWQTKTIKHSPEHSLFYIPDVQGLESPPLRISKLSVVELSRKNSGSLSNSSRDWYRVLLFDAAMRGELPYFSDIDNIWTYKLLSQILSVIAAKKTFNSVLTA